MEKTYECAHRNSYTVSKKTKNSFDIRKNMELINASEKNPLYTHKELSEKIGVRAFKDNVLNTENVKTSMLLCTNGFVKLFQKT